MGGGDMGWQTVGISVPHAKRPRRTLAVVGESISHFLFFILSIRSTLCSIPLINTLTRPFLQALGGAGQVYGATTAPLNLLLGPLDGRMTYHRTNTTKPHRSFSLPFSPSQ